MHTQTVTEDMRSRFFSHPPFFFHVRPDPPDVGASVLLAETEGDFVAVHSYLYGKTAPKHLETATKLHKTLEGRVLFNAPDKKCYLYNGIFKGLLVA